MLSAAQLDRSSSRGGGRRRWGATLRAGLLLAGLLLPGLLAFPGLAQEGLRPEVKKKEPVITRPPVLLKFVEAPYPPGARARLVQGTVELLLEVGADGRVRKTEVQQSPDPELSAAALAAASKFEFAPAEVDGKPAPVRIRFGYRFTLATEFNPRLPDWMQDRRSMAQGEDALVGRVREQGTRVPIAGAVVILRQLGIEVRADEQGRFAVAKVPPGRYQVESLSPEHRKEMVQAEVKAGEQTRIEFYLGRLAVNPYETVVRGTRRKNVVTRVSLRQRELTTVPGTFGDPIRVIENLPGVARVPYVGGALLIRGAAPEDSGVYLDGIKIPILYHFLGGPSVLNPEFLDRIDYFPGNPEVRYGRLTAGLVDVSTRNAFSEQLSGSLDVNLLNTAAFIKVPLGRRVSVAAAVRRSYIDALMPTILSASDQSATTVVPVYYDYQLRVDVKLPGDSQLFLLVFGSDDSLEVASNEPDRKVEIEVDTRISFHRVLASWRWQISDRLVSRLTPSFGIDYVTFSQGDAGIDLRSINGSLREDLELKLSDHLTLRGGLDLLLEHSTFKADVPIPADYRNPALGLQSLFTEDVQPVEAGQLRLGLGFYADALFSLGRLQIIPGARIELLRYENNLRLYADPRLTGRLKLNEMTTLKAAAGHFSQAPQPRHVSAEYGNPNLTLEHAAHFSAGIERKLLPALTFDAQLYYIRRWNMVVPTSQFRFDQGSLRALRYSNQGGGYSYGLEVLLKHDVTRRFYGWLAYTLSRARAQRRADADFDLVVFDQMHILTLVASLRLGVGWELGTRFRLVSGRPTTSVIGSFFDSDRARYRPIYGERDDSRMPLFHQLDLRVEKTWFFKLWRLAAYLDVQNIYNAENPEAILRDYRFRESGPLRGLPILPSIGIKGSF